MPVIFLTEKNVRKIKPVAGQTDDIHFFDQTPGMKGFHVTVSPSGGKTWGLKYVSPELLYPAAHKRAGKGKQRSMSLGPYYEQGGGVSFADASDRARTLKAQIATGKDPQEQDKRDSLVKAGRKTVQDVADLWTKALEYRDEPFADIKMTLKNHVVPRLGKDTPIADVKKADYSTVLMPLIENKQKSLANKVHGYLKRLFDYAANEDFIEFNPFASRREAPYAKLPKNDRFLTRDEIKTFWQITGAAAKELGHASPILRLMLATGQRIGSVCAMKRGDINLRKGVWIIPPDDIKNGKRKEKAHWVPINCVARPIIQAAMAAATGELLFPNKTGTGSIRAGEVIEAVRLTQLLFGLEHWTSHALRHTFSTHCNDTDEGGLGLNWMDVERCLDHRVPTDEGDAATYNHSKYFTPKQAVMDVWGEYLNCIITPTDNDDAADGGNVLPLHKVA